MPPAARFPSRGDLAMLATGRADALFLRDVASREGELRERLRGARVLVIGGAGSIGSATVAEITRFPVKALHVIDQSENGLTELVRDLRGRPAGLPIADFRTLPLDFGSPVTHRFLGDQAPYEFVLNFAAIKHVRSEKDAYSLLQMLDTNVLKAARLLDWLRDRGGTERYFSVSTDKAANPVNLMGASKRLMEHVIFARANERTITSARFANVAFSDGSLLDGWLRRLEKRQPLAVPRDTRRYFVSGIEAGQLCLLAALSSPGEHVVIPRLEAERHMVDLEGIARAVLGRMGLTATVYDDEQRARDAVEKDLERDHYPLLVTPLDTSGEKAFEEFVGEGESVSEIGFEKLIGVHHRPADADALASLLQWIESAADSGGKTPAKSEIVSRVSAVVTELRHAGSDRQLDQRL